MHIESRNRSSGFTIMEVIIVTGIALVVLLIGAVLISMFARFQHNVESRTLIEDVINELKTQLTNNQTCVAAFGNQVIVTGANAPYNLYRDDGTTVRFFGTPTPAQNVVSTDWRITSVRMTPFTTANLPSPGQVYWAANLIIRAQQIQGGAVAGAMEDRLIPISFTLGAGNRVASCSASNLDTARPCASDRLCLNAIQLPTCAPDARLVLMNNPVAGQPPIWGCRTL